MPELAQTFATCNIGVENLATPGTPVPATRTLGALKATVAPQPDVKTFTPSGSKFASAAVLIKETSSVKLDGIGTYNELVYPLAGILTYPLITTPAGATKTRQHLFAMQSLQPDAQRQYSMEFGTNSVRAWHLSYCQMIDFGLSFSRKDGLKATGSMLAQPIVDDKVRWLSITGSPAGGNFTITVGGQTTAAIPYNATAAAIQTALATLSNVGAGNVVVTGGPLPASPVRIRFTGTFELTALPAMSTTDTLTGGTSPATSLGRMSPGAAQMDLIPIAAPQLDVYGATTYAGLAGAAKLQRAFKGDWKIGGRNNPVMPLNSSNGAGFAGMVEAQPKPEFSIDVSADDIGMGYMPRMRRGETCFFRIAGTGPAIETVGSTTFYNLFQVDVAVKLTKVSELKDIDGGLLGVTYSGEWTHDPTWGYATQVLLQNDVAAL